MLRIALIAVFAAFGTYSLYVVAQVGYFGLWQGALASHAGIQVTLDLIITSMLLLGFLWRDAQKTGRRFWPYAAITLAGGSFGPMLYLLLAPRDQRAGALASVSGKA